VIQGKKFVVFSFSLLFCSAPLFAQSQPVRPNPVLDGVISKIITRENQEMAAIRQRSPIVETYIQKARNTENDGSWTPDGDHYFIGRAEFSNGIGIEPLPTRQDDSLHHVAVGLAHAFNFGTEFMPRGFLQMIFLDNEGLDTRNYHFDYVRREFLGEVRTLVFDVTPAKKTAKGRFIGRIWVEDEGFTIVRFNGSYSGRDYAYLKFHFDSWRVNAGPNLWLPAFIYSEEDAPRYSLAKERIYKAQTRLWGYNIGQAAQEQKLSKILIESKTPVIDKSQQGNDLSPVQQARAWDQQAEDNIIDKLQREGLVAPKGEVDKILETVVNNLEVTNNLDFHPEIQCRVLTTSTIESFTIGHTIVLSRGLIDVLPDEASLAVMLAKELGYIMIDPRNVDTRFAFFDRIQSNPEKTFPHFDFDRRPEDDAAASAKGAELLKKSPYKDQLATAEMFMAELRDRSSEIPNLISPRLGDAGLLQLPVAARTDEEAKAGHIVALPLGGRVKMNPWNDTLEMLKARTVGAVAEREKMPFEITPFVIYLTRVANENTKDTNLIGSSRPETQTVAP